MGEIISGNSMVAVCDILGYSNLVESSSLHNMIDLHLNNIKNLIKSSTHYINRNKDVYPSPSLGYSIFSDTVFLYSLSDTYEGYRSVLHAVYSLIRQPMFTPIYRFRAGISYGEFYHDKKESLYTGKAMVEAYKLEKIQQWSGAALTETAADKFKNKSPESDLLVDYDVPVRLPTGSTHKILSVVNWTYGPRHPEIPGKPNWMEREEKGVRVDFYKDKNVEQKILNTEKFHSDNCIQCQASNYLP